MVGIVTGNGLGLLGGSLGQLGGLGGLGSSGVGAGGSQAYVNAANGNLILQRQDEFLRGLGIDAGLLRTYNSAGQFNDPNTDNWRLGFNRRVWGLTGSVNTAGSTVTRTDADGSEAVYTYDVASGRYVSNAGAGAQDTLVYDGAWTWRDGDTQTTEHYSGTAEDSRLAAIVDRDGHTLTLTYTGDLVTRIETASGERIDLVYDTAAGRTANLVELDTQIRLPDGSYQSTNRVRYGYDASNRLTSVTVDLTPADGSIADGKTYVTQYSYDVDGRITGITQTDGSEVRFTYDAQGRVATVSDVRSATDIRVTTFDYSVTGQTTVTDALGQSTTLAYDTDGQLTSLTNAAGTVSYTYDAAGNVLSATDARGNTTVYAYDDRNNRLSQRDALGNIVEWTYNEANQVTSETTYRIADPDGAGVQGPDEPQVAKYIYDANGKLRFAVSADGRVTEWRYNAQGLEATRVTYAGGFYTDAVSDEATMTAWAAAQDLTHTQRVDTAYDFRGNVQSVTSYASVGADGVGIAAGQSQTQYVYDPAGRLLQTIDPRGVATTDIANDYVTTYAYDGLGRLLTTLRTDASGNSVLLGSTVYDDANRQTTVTLANGLVTTTTYDTAGHAVSVVQSDGNNSQSPVGRTDYVYDANDRLVAQRVTTGAGSILSSYAVYDDAGRKVADIGASGTLTEYVYNANGQVVRTIGYANRVTPAQLAGDPAGFTLDALRPAAGADRVVRQVYDAAGRLVKTIDAEGAVVAYEYDGASQLVQTTAYANRLTAAQLAALAGSDDLNPADPNTMPASDAANDRVTRQFYSDDGLLLGTLDGEGALTERIYDAAGQLVQTIQYIWPTDPALRADGTLEVLRPQGNNGSTQNIVSYTFYDAQGQAIASVDAEGYLTEVHYDAVGNIVQTIRYANPVTATVTAEAALADLRPAASGNDRTVTSLYDGNNRLVHQESQPDGLVTVYTYDAVGNVTSVVRTDGTAQRQGLSRVDVLGRVIATLTPENAARITAGMDQAQIDAIWNTYATRNSYDQAGRLVASTDALGRTTHFYYDDAGRLTVTVNAAGEVSQTVYNAFGEATENWHYKGALTETQLATITGGSDSDAALADVLDVISNVGIVKTRSDLNLRGQIAAAYDALGNATQYSYNAFGDVTQTSRTLGNGNTVVSTLAYDRRGLITEQHADSTGIDAVTVNAYDAFGRLIQRTAPNGVVTTAGYDRLGRNVRTQVGATWQEFGYDAFGRTLTVTNSDGTTTTVYADDQKQLTVTTPESIQTRQSFNAFGELISIVDGLGNTTTYQYNKDGQLTSVTDPAGTRTTAYDAAGQVISTTDRNGTVTSYTYDAVGRTLSRTVDPTGLNLTTSYQYDALGRSVLMQDANGIWTRTDYDDRGQVTMIEVDPDGLGLKTAYTYDAAGNTVTVTEGFGTAAARTTQYTYDALNRRTAETVDPTGLALTTRYTYDDAGNVTAKTDPAGHITYYGYDANGRLTVMVDPTGAVTRTTYDAQNRVVATDRYAALVDPAVLAAVDTDGIRTDAALLALLPAGTSYTRTQMAYDHDGRLVYTVDAGGAVRQNVYDANGNVIKHIAYTNRIILNDIADTGTIAALIVAQSNRDQATSYVYDTANRLIESRDGKNIATHYSYDANGNVIDKTVGFDLTGAATTHSVYDAAGRLIEQTTAFGTTSQATTRYAYDALGNRLAETDPRGVELAEEDTTWALAQRKALGYTDANGVVKLAADLTAEERTALLARYTSTTTYDAAGRKIETTDALGSITQYTYDARGNLVQLTDPRGNSAYFYYDADNRRTLYVDPEGYVSKTDYDADGNVATITQYANRADGGWDAQTEPTVAANAARDRVTHYQYDALGRQTGMTDAQGFSELRSYDAFGNLATLTNQAGGVTVYYYDARGLLLTEILPVTAANATGVQVPVVKQYTYDARGNRLTETEAVGLPEQRTTTYAYDLNDRVVSKTGQAVAVLDGSFNAVTAASTETYTYDARGNRTVVDSNGRRTVSYYDANNRKIAEVDAAGTLTTWTLDDAGNAIAKRIYDYPVSLPADPAIVPSSYYYRETRYAFDANNRLTATSQTTDISYSYNGGLAHSTLVTSTNTYDANGNVVKTVDPNGNATYSFYDTLGNRTLQVDAMGYGMAWDYDGAGNVVRETRYASGLDAATLEALDIDSDAQSLKAQFASGNQAASDRITELDYDGMGRVTAQRVLNVAYASINGTGGKADATGVAITTFTYNGLGKVTQQVDANGSTIDIGYDALGREILRQQGSFTGIDGTPTRQTTTTAYNGLSEVTTVTQLGKTPNLNRVTTNTYDQAGNLIAQSDALGNVTTFGVNVWGETVQTSISRKNADQSTTTDVKRYTYDAMGRQVEQRDQATGTTSNTRYDAFGAITGRGTNGVYSETTEYDSLGRVWRTNNGNGITRAYIYDANGNATLQIDSAGADIGNMTLDDMLSSNDVKPTITVFDKRNQVTDIIQPNMTFVHEDAGIQSILVPVGNADPFTTGNLAIAAGNVLRREQLSVYEDHSDIWESDTITLSFPNLNVYGEGSIRLETEYTTRSPYYTQKTTKIYPSTQTSISFEIGLYTSNGYSSLEGVALRTKLVKDTPYGPIIIYDSSQFNGTNSSYWYASSTINLPPVAIPKQLIFKGQPLSASTLKLKYRPAGSTGAYTEVMVPKQQINGNTVTGSFAMDWSGIPAGTKEYVYEAYDASGKVINRVGGQMVINGASSSITSQTAQNLDPVYVTQLKWVITGSQSESNQIHQTQEHNAFGEVVAEVDGLGRRTEFAYNALGKLVLKRDPETDITLANGFITRGRPETRYFYDLMGNTVGVQDANGNLNTVRYVAGAVDASGAAVVEREFHADGGVIAYAYDEFGQLRRVTNELGDVTQNSYDANGNLILVDRAGANDDRYEYDALGNRIAHTNALGNRESWTYDSLGRVTRAVSFAGRVTSTAYAWNGAIMGLGTDVNVATAVGGWTKTVTDAAGRFTTETADVFGRLRASRDLGGHLYTYKYNSAGWLSQQSNSAGQLLVYDYYDNGYVKTITDVTNNTLTKYEYDDAGNRTFEGYTTATGTSREYYQYAEITYDELNRVKTVHDPKYLITYEYDAVGNRRRVLSTYSDGVGGNIATQDYWYLYDSMNRFTLTKGTLADGRALTADGASSIIKGTEGVVIGYDQNGQRISATYSDHGETYTYQNGQLANTYIDGVLRATRSNLDANGNPTNQVKYVEYNANGSVRTNSTYTYDADNLLTTDRDNLTGYGLTYSYLGDGTLDRTVSFGQSTVVTTTYAYEWWDSAKQKEIKVQASNASAPGWKPGFSRMTYDSNGNLKTAEDVAGGRSMRYVTNGEGLILQRNEIVNNTIAKTHNWYYANSQQIGDVGNDGQSTEDYAQQLAQKKNLSTKELNQRFKPVDTADFDQNYQPINATYPALTASSYMVKSGDTLQSVARAVWGDASLWYMIADANGLTANSTLIAGTTLTIPNKVANIHNTSETFKVYNPGEKIGDTSPTLPDAPPPPRKKGGCGGLGSIITVVVAAVVAYVTQQYYLLNVATPVSGAAGAAAYSTGSLVASGVAAGAAGSVAGQLTGMAIGVQDKFSWNGVALSAIGGGVTAGFSSGTVGGNWSDAATRAAIGNATTQGIGVVTGLQRKFDWRGVAAAGVGAGIGSAVGGTSLGKIGGDIFGGIAAGGVLSGGKFDSQTMASVIGSVIGSSITGQYGNQISDDPLGDFINATQKVWSANQNENSLYANVVNDPEKLSAYNSAIAQGASNEDAVRLAQWVDIKRDVETQYLLSKDSSIDAGTRDNARKTANVLTSALVSKDVYFENSISAILPNGVSRLNDADLADLGVSYINSDFQNEEGYFGALYINNDIDSIVPEFIYANRGTEVGAAGFKDAITDIAQALGFKDQQFTHAMNLGKGLFDELNGNISFVGHSLGGALAAAQAAMTNGHAITFNAAGISDGTIRRFNLDSSGSTQRIAAFNVGGELLTTIQENPITSLASLYYTTIPKNIMATVAVVHDIFSGETPDFTRFGLPIIPSSMGSHIDMPAVSFENSLFNPIERLTNSLSSHSMDAVLKSLEFQIRQGNGLLPTNYLINIQR